MRWSQVVYSMRLSDWRHLKRLNSSRAQRGQILFNFISLIRCRWTRSSEFQWSTLIKISAVRAWANPSAPRWTKRYFIIFRNILQQQLLDSQIEMYIHLETGNDINIMWIRCPPAMMDEHSKLHISSLSIDWTSNWKFTICFGENWRCDWMIEYIWRCVIGSLHRIAYGNSFRV